MKNRNRILLHPIFILSLLLLVINDFILKQHFQNFITGKLSDFAGLFAFTLFFIAMFPGREKLITILVVVFFLFWKTSLSQPFIERWNDLNFYPIDRIVDYTDFFALPMTWLAYKFSLKERRTLGARYLTIPVAIFALFSFCATSYSHNYEINKSFELPMSKKDVIEKINQITSSCSDYKPLSTDVRFADSSWVDFSMDTVYYSVTGNTHYIDTMWNYDRSGNKAGIDTIYYYTFPQTDTMFVSSSGFFIMHFNVKEYLELAPEEYCECVEARCRISEKSGTSILTVLTVDGGPCIYVKPGDKGSDELINAFEEQIINKIHK